jgi:hypothetical protein
MLIIIIEVVQLTLQYMVNSMVMLQFRVNDIMVVSSHVSFNIDGDLNMLTKTTKTL